MSGCSAARPSTRRGDPFPEAVRDACRRSDAVLLGAVGGPRWERGGPRPEQGIMGLRKALDTYANLRPIRRWYAGAVSPLRPELIAGVDLLIVRELTGGLYFGERGRTPTGAFDTLSLQRARDQAHPAHRLPARARAPRAPASMDKANVLESSRLWRELAEGDRDRVPRRAARAPGSSRQHDDEALRAAGRAFEVRRHGEPLRDILLGLAASLARHRAGDVGLAGRSAGPGVCEPSTARRPTSPAAARRTPRARASRRRCCCASSVSTPRRPTSSRPSSPCSTAAR